MEHNSQASSMNLSVRSVQAKGRYYFSGVMCFSEQFHGDTLKIAATLADFSEKDKYQGTTPTRLAIESSSKNEAGKNMVTTFLVVW